jgi:hypothetical protein
MRHAHLEEVVPGYQPYSAGPSRIAAAVTATHRITAVNGTSLAHVADTTARECVNPTQLEGFGAIVGASPSALSRCRTVREAFGAFPWTAVRRYSRRTRWPSGRVLGQARMGVLDWNVP